MPLIKRYPNRKLYNTDTKQYITLDEIANLIREGDDVRVIDNTSGEDLTALTLTQIIFEQEKKQSGFLPRSILSSLIQAGGDRLHALQRNLIGAVGLGYFINDEIKQRITSLVTSGELSEDEGQDLMEKLVSKEFRIVEEGPRILRGPAFTTEELEKYLSEHEMPTQNDLKRLIDQLDALSSELDEIRSTGT
jgi:polyhydroxyalkanoate synthesis repressor PhaR